MRIKFNKFERVAGIFVLAAIIGSLTATMGIAVQKGWFASKVEYKTYLDSAEGIHSGTLVQIAGLRAGSVQSVDLISANEVLIKFQVFEKFKHRIREDSMVQVTRPFVIGEKVFEVTVGSESSKMLEPGTVITAKEGFDLMDVFSGRKLGPFLGTIEALVSNLQILVEAFADEKRMKSVIALFDEMTPLVNNMNTMSKRIVTISDAVMEKKKLIKVVDNVVVLTSEMNKILPQINEDSPNLGRQISSLVSNLSDLTQEFKKLTPAINVIAPELPRVSKRAVEGLDELVITLKAIQKSFLLRGNVDDVKEEEKKMREPAKE
ncbi:MAG: MCE family protein [Bdellovibrionaceae bacterium]|nr:MCE family protein [Pseudobdellovibrionaceae bacterium]MCB9092893.1 MCE family protein [Halobacteriovoraceae bacterium]